jgi:hypothetical protein
MSEKDILDVIKFYRRVGETSNDRANETVEERLYKRLAGFTAEQRRKIIDWLLENNPRKNGLDMIILNEAINNTHIYTSAYTPAREWTCDLCGLRFKYAPSSTREDNFKGIFDYCPRCGLSVDVMLSSPYEKLKPWYKEFLKKQYINWHYNRKDAWVFDAEKEKEWDAREEKRKAELVQKNAQELYSRFETIKREAEEMMNPRNTGGGEV